MLAVDDPAGQPFVTPRVGGATLDTGGTPQESVWDASLLTSSPGGGRGGVSDLREMHRYRSGEMASLHVASHLSAYAASGGRSGGAGGQVAAGTAVPGCNCREVPDVSANAGATYAISCAQHEPDRCADGGWTGLSDAIAPTAPPRQPPWASLSGAMGSLIKKRRKRMRKKKHKKMLKRTRWQRRSK